MNEGFAWWLLIAGIGIGVALAWLIMGRLARADDDIDEDERAEEAAWISRSIAAYGGVAPPALVEEILDLHRHYLAGPGLEPSADRVTTAPDPDDDALAVDPDEPAVAEPPATPERGAGVRRPAGGSPSRASGES